MLKKWMSGLILYLQKNLHFDDRWPDAWSDVSSITLFNDYPGAIQIAGPLVFDEASQLGQSGPFGDLRLAVSDMGVSGRTVEYEVFVQNKDGGVLFQHAGKNPIVHHSGEWVVFSNTTTKGFMLQISVDQH